MQPIYLDYNATTPAAPQVRDAIIPYLTDHFGNPSSSHVLGRTCKEVIQAARGQVAALLGAEADEILFTSGGTESNNHVFKGLAAKRSSAEGGRFIISAVEHPAITEPAEFLRRQGFEVTVIGTDSEGIVDVGAIREAMGPDVVLVSVMHANNEIGAIQPIAEISRICRESGTPLHTDAAQSMGKIPVKVDELGVDLLTIAGHKLYAPKGIGALYVRRGIELEPFMHGAGHEQGRRAGTENTPYIVGLGRAAELADEHLSA
ncbi:MAG: cysteine desulfurase, partial [Planctomycetales bacterium]